MQNFRNANLLSGSPLGAVDVTVALTADNQFVATQGLSTIKLTSDNTTATNRTFTLQSALNPTQDPGGNYVLTLIFESGSSTTCELANSGNVKLSAAWTPTQYGTLTLQWDGFFWIELARSPVTVGTVGDGTVTVAKLAPAVMVELTGTLTQANIIAMNGTPVELIPVAAAGACHIIDEVEFFHSYSTAAYTGGGDLTIQYDSGASAILDFDVTLVTNASSLKTLAHPTIYNLDSTTGTSTGFNLANAVAKNVTITNATAVFAAGNASNVLKYRIRYHTVTVLV